MAEITDPAEVVEGSEIPEDMDPGEYKYTFFGKLMPERGANTVTRTQAITEDGWIDISIQVSQISAVYHRDVQSEEELTMRNTVLESVYGITDMMAFTHGFGYDVSIDVMVRPDGSQRVFGVGIPVIESKLTDEEKEEYALKIAQLLVHVENEYLRMALKNLRSSMADPVDSPMFCYRAIESLRKEMEDRGASKENSWDALWDYIGYSGEPVRTMGKEFAHDSRHGRRISITSEDRAEIYDITWSVIKRYIDTKYEALSEKIDETS